MNFIVNGFIVKFKTDGVTIIFILIQNLVVKGFVSM